MPIRDNLLVQVQPQAGQTAIRNEIGGANFTGTGTPTLVDEGAEKAWSLTTGTLLDFAVPAKTINAAITGAGATIAFRFKQTANGSGADFLQLVGIRDGSGVASSFAITRNGNTAFRGRYSVSPNPVANFTGTSNNVIYTIVVKIVAGGSFTRLELWRNTAGRVGTAADVVGSAQNTGAGSPYNSAFINCQNSVAYTLLDFAYWDRELTDAECATVADDIRTALAPPATAPVSFNGTVSNQSATVGTAFNLSLASFYTGNQTPFAYSLVAGSLTGTGLSLNTSTGVISGTPSTDGTISGLQVRATDAANNTADSNTFSITVAAAASNTITATYTVQRPTFAAAVTNTAPAVASFTLTDLAANNDVPWSNTSGITVDVYNPATGALVVRKTGLTSTAGADLTVSDAAMTAGTTYNVFITIGSAYGAIKATAA